jgi:DNA-binding transcriptional regulator YdaS (Cro superfamily)
MNAAIVEACRKAGSQAALARLLSVKPSTVNEWYLGEGKVPLERCVDIERGLGVTCEELRPDKVEFFCYLRNRPGPATGQASSHVMGAHAPDGGGSV